MSDPKPSGPLGTNEPGAFDLRGRAIKKFDSVLGVAKQLAPNLPLPVQKGIKIADAEHNKRDKNLLDPGTGDSGDVAAFVLGPAVAPPVNFDHGFLDRVVGGKHVIDDSKRQAPTKRDYDHLRLWEAAALGGLLVRKDLIDAVFAYEHFLLDNGTPYHFSYDRFLTSDESGQRVLASVLADARQGALDLATGLARRESPLWLQTFQMVSGVVEVADCERYPYPSTENWQKAIGGHAIWISANVEMAIDPTAKTMTLTVALTIHAVDMYNFNPDNHDITTGIADAENGRFEVTGLAHEFLQTGEATRTFSFQAPLPPMPGLGPGAR
jgi:hypothetical protein